MMHWPARGPVWKHSLPMGMGPFGTMHVAREASDAGWGTGVAKTSVQVGMLVFSSNLSLATDFA